MPVAIFIIFVEGTRVITDFIKSANFEITQLNYYQDVIISYNTN